MPREIRVGPDEWGDYATIEEAVAIAKPGDVIWIRYGVYKPITVPAGVHLVAYQAVFGAGVAA